MANLDPVTVGARLRSVRTSRRLTLADVSSDTGVSVSTLSRLESGSRRATLELLVSLARTYRVTLDELVDAPPTGDPRVHLKPVEHPHGPVISLTNRVGGPRAFKMVMRPDGREPDPRSHEGHDWIYVLDGRLRLVLGEHDLVLGVGEVAEFDTRTPHWFGCADDRPVELLSIMGPQGERMHVRARSKPRG
ncbi:helix-turn-helix transcriptional regulator [Phycicoccus sp. CSK15P-2]|uniref:helix-turn-helix domain-containing protein n=1 Tax=Phycicoccus sp. CSK15P-2 TaxID=2807627 RepID=UPI001950C234|nr:XRE family transcriptional regulator [Phycicoccus sp. CSK15P-2]MBM6405795.1 helix-turn-helix transcriptional regulator [Phycicoccus sp. CSK15P-2]